MASRFGHLKFQTKVFFILTFFKVCLKFFRNYLVYLLWKNDGLLEYNNVYWEFVVNPIIYLPFGVLPYYLLYKVAVKFKLRTAFVVAGLSLLFADFYSEYQFIDSSDAQTAIAVALIYLIYFIAIASALWIYGFKKTKKWTAGG